MLPLPVPASVYGLVLLLAALTAGVVKLEQVKETGTYLTGIFPLLFVPAAAGIMELWAEMGQLLLPILIAILPVTVLVVLIPFLFWLMIILLVVGLFTDFRYSFRGPNLGSDAINDTISKASDMADSFKAEVIHGDSEENSKK